MQKKRQNICNIKDYPYLCTAFKKCNNMVTVVQLVRASDCGSECRGFESLQSPKRKRNFSNDFPLFLLYIKLLGGLIQKYGLSRFLAGIIFYTREVLLTSHYEKRLFEHASQPRVACADIRLLSYLWSRTNLSRDSYQSG